MAACRRAEDAVSDTVQIWISGQPLTFEKVFRPITLSGKPIIVDHRERSLPSVAVVQQTQHGRLEFPL